VISSAVFDLETSDLDGDKGIILCAVIKSSITGKKTVIRTDKTNKDWSKGLRGNDKHTVEQISRELQKHDVLVAHNGNRFDVPFLRTRCLRWDLPTFPAMKLVDPMRIFFNKFRLRRNSLANISDYLGVKARKTPLDMSVWMDAMQNGTIASMDLIVEHCMADVDVLEAVLNKVMPFVKILDDRGSGL
jgi:uncharacterized protein YprB with RNaseH-like and TPR domain